MTRLTIELHPHVVGHLDELANSKAATREQVLTSLIETEYHSKRQTLDDSPWEITLAAKEMLLKILGRDVTPASLDDADDILHTACLDAHRAEVEGRRRPTPNETGLKYRGPKPQRLTLVVRNGSLVAVYAGRGR